MANDYFIQQKKRRSWQRTASLVLLLLCFFDLAITDVFFLGTCEQESEMRSVPPTQIPTVSNHSESEQHQSPPESSAEEEDCICCCAHIMPVALYQFPSPSLNTDPVISTLPIIPSAPSVELYHPPRFV